MSYLISIIVPVYNTKEIYLGKCLDSLINQTYKNIEIIIVDDGSEKWCKTIYQKYLDDTRIKIIIQENQGVSVARNNGMNQAVGEYIMFVDSDDYLELDCCEKLIQQINKNSLDIIKIMPFENKKNNNIFQVKNIRFYPTKLLDANEKKDLIKSLFINGTREVKFAYSESTWGKLYKKSFLQNNNLNFKDDLKIGEDWLFNYEAYFKANTIYNLNECLYHYVINEKSVMQSFNTFIVDNYKLLFKYYKELIKIYKVVEDKKDFDFFVFKQLKRQIKVYFCNKENKKIYRLRKREFLDLILCKPYCDILKKLTFKLTFKENFIYFLIKNKMFFVLDILCKLRDKN